MIDYIINILKEIFKPKEKLNPVQPPSTTVDHRFDNMTKREIAFIAREEFNGNLDRRHNKKRLINQMKKLAKGK